MPYRPSAGIQTNLRRSQLVFAKSSSAKTPTVKELREQAKAKGIKVTDVTLTVLDSADESASEVWEAALERARVELEQALRDHIR